MPAASVVVTLALTEVLAASNGRTGGVNLEASMAEIAVAIANTAVQRIVRCNLKEASPPNASKPARVYNRYRRIEQIRS